LAAPTRAGVSFWSKCFCWWLYHVLGYTNFAESVVSGSYDPTDMTGVTSGSNGSINISGSDFNFRDNTANPFVVGDVGKWILIIDLLNPENSGWYPISAYVGVDTVTIDFRSGGAEYPTQVLGNNLAWYMMAEDNNTPDTVTDYWRLRTPHADGWEIELAIGGNQYLQSRISLDQDWTASGKILEAAAPKFFGQQGTASASNMYYYAEGNTEGDHLNLWWFSTTNPAGNAAITVSRVTPYETSPAHSADELLVMAGVESNLNWGTAGFVRGITVASQWTGIVWRDDDASVNRCYALEWSYAASSSGFSQWSSNEANARTGKNDIKPGVTFIVDKDNDASKYEVMGSYAGLFEGRNNFSKMQTIDDAATKDKVHIYDGFFVPWPGYTPQFNPL
jgi:hypothetical protein